MIKVLDHGHVRLVDHMGSDLSVVRSARVSYNAEPRLDGSDDKLIHYLMRNNHTSPVESVTFTFEVKAPIFVFRQWHRYRTQSVNEISARYTELPEEFYVPTPDKVGVQLASSKQARDLTSHEDAELVCFEIRRHCRSAFDAYKSLLGMDVPRELARTVLPLATYSVMFTTLNLHNLFHFLKLRLHPHAQYEIRVYAEALLELIEPIVPVCVAAFKEYGLPKT